MTADTWLGEPVRLLGSLILGYGVLALFMASLEQGLPRARPFPDALGALALSGAVWVVLSLALVRLVGHVRRKAWPVGRRLALYAGLALISTWLVNGSFVGVEWLSGQIPAVEVPGRMRSLAIFNLPVNAAWTLLMLAGIHLVLREKDQRSKAQTAGQQQHPVLTVCLGRRRRPVPVSDIRWIEGDGDYVKLHTTAGCHVYDGRLFELEAELAGHGFIRVHRSALVNRHAVRETERSEAGMSLVLDGGQRVPVSRRRRAEVRRTLEAAPSSARPERSA